jgi:tRNA 2-thiouridine synthesizing protein A
LTIDAAICWPDDRRRPEHHPAMTTILDLTGLKCPMPVLRTRKALQTLRGGERLEVHCTDPMAVIDIPTLVNETGDRLERSERSDERIVFVIEKC